MSAEASLTDNPSVLLLLAFFSGLLLTLIFPLPGLSALSWAALVPVIISSIRARGNTSFFYGYFCGLIWSLGTLHWTYIYHNFSIYPVVLITSIYPGLFSLAVGRIARRTGISSVVFSVPVIWTSLEYIRSLGFAGFPWNSLGYAHFRNIPLIQISSFTGVFGVTFLVCLVNGLLSFSLMSPGRINTRVYSALAALMLPCAIYSAGQYMINNYCSFKPHRIRIAGIQTGFSHEIDWAENYLYRLENIRELLLRASEHQPSLIILPESAVEEDAGRFFELGHPFKHYLCGPISGSGAHLLLGAPHFDGIRRFNSAFLVSPECKVIQRYDKIKLVPGGEHFPYFRDKHPIARIFEDAGDYTPGDSITVFRIPETGFSALICFEGIFGALAARFVNEGAQFLVNITNDVWSRSMTSHYQHASMSIFRAVENRVYLVRVGNTGISKIIRPCGSIEQETGFMSREIITAEIGLRGESLTFYTRYGDIFARAVLAAGALLLFRVLLKGKSRR